MGSVENVLGITWLGELKVIFRELGLSSRGQPNFENIHGRGVHKLLWQFITARVASRRLVMTHATPLFMDLESLTAKSR